MLLDLGTLDFLLLELQTSRGQHRLVVAATRAVIDMEALVQEIVTGTGIIIETRVTMKEKMLRNIILQNHVMGLQVTIKVIPTRRVLHALSGKEYLAVIYDM